MLCPSRARPDDLRRLCTSINTTAKNKDKVEILAYLDQDDLDTNEEEFKDIDNLRFFRGPRVWMSHAQNFLYCQSKGEIIMACADDFVFRTHSWDEIIWQEFAKYEDRIILIFGNDLGIHAGKLPTHFFLHRNIPEILGTWVMQGRASLWDLWAFDVFSQIKRVLYLRDVEIEHLNFRQSKSNQVKVDQTTKDVTSQQFMFRPHLTYNMLFRERRIDSLILAERAQVKINLEFKYFASHFVAKVFSRKLSQDTRFRILSMKNSEFLGAIWYRLTRLLK